MPKALNHPSLRIIASADSMAPVHGGLFLLRPSVAAYRRGIATLHARRWKALTDGITSAARGASFHFNLVTWTALR